MNMSASAIEHWNQRVRAHHAQSIKAQEATSWSTEDQWQPFASYFRADPRRTDDPILNRFLGTVTPATTALDVGGGAGRYALPLALNCRQVTVVEPSASMIKELRAGAQEAGVENLSIVQGLWEDVAVEPADVVLCANVVYDVADIAPFIQKLEDHAREQVWILIFMEPVSSLMSPFWEPVHGEKRIDPPAMPEFLMSLWEMDIYPNVEMFDPLPPQSAPTQDVALGFLRHFLYVRPGTDHDQRLQSAMTRLVVETPAGFTIRMAKPSRPALISWRPQ
jgi:SAM-dependent methyltransferase